MSARAPRSSPKRSAPASSRPRHRERPPFGGRRSRRFTAAPPPRAGGYARERPPKIPPRACRRRSRGAVLLRAIRRRSVAPRTAGRDRAMFGIVGDVGDKDAAPLLIEPLKRLEYREYDSSGLAVLITRATASRSSSAPTAPPTCSFPCASRAGATASCSRPSVKSPERKHMSNRNGGTKSRFGRRTLRCLTDGKRSACVNQ